MVCQRCSGLLVREIFDDLSAEAGITFMATRCVNCGYIEDSVVCANRLHHSPFKRFASRGIVKKGGVVFLQSHPERARLGTSRPVPEHPGATGIRRNSVAACGSKD
jgi:hypothetical protein